MLGTPSKMVVITLCLVSSLQPQRVPSMQSMPSTSAALCLGERGIYLPVSTALPDGFAPCPGAAPFAPGLSPSAAEVGGAPFLCPSP